MHSYDANQGWIRFKNKNDLQNWFSHSMQNLYQNHEFDRYAIETVTTAKKTAEHNPSSTFGQIFQTLGIPKPSFFNSGTAHTEKPSEKV